jgi:hypothetical protein
MDTSPLPSIDSIHNQVINCLKQTIPNNPIIYFHNCPPYFFQESLEDNKYRATIILNGMLPYFVVIQIENIDNISDINNISGDDSPINFTLLKQVDLKNERSY